VLFFAGAAGAADVGDEGKPALGAHVLYSFIPDSFLNGAFSEHTSIAGVGYGVWFSYGLSQFDLLFQVNNWSLLIGDGAWLNSGDSVDQRNYLEANLGMIDFSMAPIWKWRVHPAVEPYVGPLFGFAMFYGEATMDEAKPNGKPKGDPKDKEMPPVVPGLGFLGGCRFYPAPNFRLSVDLGFYYGLAAGVSVGYAF
jgi:hypothetical protein